TSEPLLALQCNRNTAGMALRAVPITSKLFESNSIKLYQLVKDEAPQALCAVANNRNPAWTNRYMLRMNVSHTLVPKGEKVGETKVDPWWRLPASHFAILAEKKVKGKVVASARFYPVAYAALTPKGQWTAWQAEDRNALFVARSDRVVLDYVEYIQSLIDQEKVKKPSGTAPPRLYSRHLWLTVDWVYCLPEGYAPKAFLYRDSLRESLKDTFPFAEMELRKRALHIRSPDEKKKKSKRRR
ncbi:MAG: hypothetical protein HN909_07595, partial [Phycisphaerales bacterium]|nr:hypothetical protein [Phycisphaerales bacterium]